jgi:hypothetical protein
MTEQEARKICIQETNYCYVLARVWSGNPHDSISLERIFTKGRCEEIRLAWWKKGRFQPRPADLDAVEWVSLFKNAISGDIFTGTEINGMLKTLKELHVPN